MLEKYIQKKWEWVDRNPRAAAWISWIKGLVMGGLLVYAILELK